MLTARNSSALSSGRAARRPSWCWLLRHLRGAGGFLRPRQRWQQQRSEQRDDRNDHQQFNQREAAVLVLTWSFITARGACGNLLGGAARCDTRLAVHNHGRVCQRRPARGVGVLAVSKIQFVVVQAGGQPTTMRLRQTQRRATVRDVGPIEPSAVRCWSSALRVRWWCRQVNLERRSQIIRSRRCGERRVKHHATPIQRVRHAGRAEDRLSRFGRGFLAICFEFRRAGQFANPTFAYSGAGSSWRPSRNRSAG